MNIREECMSLTVSVSEKETGIMTISPVGAIDASTYAVLETQVDSCPHRGCLKPLALRRSRIARSPEGDKGEAFPD